METQQANLSTIFFASLVVLAFIAGLLVLRRRRYVQLDKAGVVTRNGTPTDRVLRPGWHIVNFYEGIEEVPVTRIPPGTVGVVFNRDGTPTDRILTPNADYYLSPFHVNVIQISIQDKLFMVVIKPELASQVVAKGNADFTDFPLDTEIDDVKIWIPYTISFRIAPENARRVVEKFGDIEGVVRKVVQPRSREIVRRTFRDELRKRNVRAEELIGQVRDDIENIMAEQVSKVLAENGITVSHFNLREPDTGEWGATKRQERLTVENLQSEQRVFEEQRLKKVAEEALNEVIRKEKEEAAASDARIELLPRRAMLDFSEMERQQREANEATEERIKFNRAENEARIRVASAEAEAQANKALASSITPELITLLQAKAQTASAERWNGQLPMFSSGVSPFLNLSAGLLDLLKVNRGDEVAK